MFNPDEKIIIDGEAYRIVERIGCGGQCETWKAERLGDYMFVALRTVCGFNRAADGRWTPRSFNDVLA